MQHTAAATGCTASSSTAESSTAESAMCIVAVAAADGCTHKNLRYERISTQHETKQNYRGNWSELTSNSIIQMVLCNHIAQQVSQAC